METTKIIEKLWVWRNTHWGRSIIIFIY